MTSKSAPRLSKTSKDSAWRMEDMLAPHRDDRAREAAKKRRGKHGKQPKPPPDDGSPRCARCLGWSIPNNDGFGQCRRLYYVERSAWQTKDGWEIVGVEEARTTARDSRVRKLEPLRTAAHFVCNRFDEREAA